MCRICWNKENVFLLEMDEQNILMTLSNTGVMCMVHIGERSVDMGNYYVNNKTGERVLVTNQELAQKYSRFINVPIYVRRPTPREPDPASAAP